MHETQRNDKRQPRAEVRRCQSEIGGHAVNDWIAQVRKRGAGADHFSLAGVGRGPAVSAGGGECSRSGSVVRSGWGDRASASRVHSMLRGKPPTAGRHLRQPDTQQIAGACMEKHRDHAGALSRAES